jgi:N-methylhydantoinase A
LLVADIRYDFRQTHVEAVRGSNIDDVERVFAALEQRGREALRLYGLADSTITFQRSADMRYRRQAYEINMRLPDRVLTAADQPLSRKIFTSLHERMYGRRDTAGVIQFVTLAVTAVGNTRRLENKPSREGRYHGEQGAPTRTESIFPRPRNA